MAVMTAAAIAGILSALGSSSSAGSPSGPTNVIPSIRIEAPVIKGIRTGTDKTVPDNTVRALDSIAAGNIGLVQAQQEPFFTPMSILIIGGLALAAFVVVK